MVALLLWATACGPAFTASWLRFPAMPAALLAFWALFSPTIESEEDGAELRTGISVLTVCL